jgi:hypothetical protein
MQLRHTRADRETALGLARSVLLRALACTPPGKLRTSVFDPTGLGQSVSSLLEQNGRVELRLLLVPTAEADDDRGRLRIEVRRQQPAAQ